MSRPDDARAHLSEEAIQGWLDGQLERAEAARLEAHLLECPVCRHEVEAWRSLTEALGGLERLTPEPGFEAGVLAGVRRPGGPAAAPAVGGTGIRGRIGAWAARLRGRPDGHPGPELLQDLVDGTLGRRRSAALRRHLDDCPACREEATGWRSLAATLHGLPRHAPSPGFAWKVLSRVQVSPAPRPSSAHPLAGRIRGALGTRQDAWAALAGFAVTPAVTLGLVTYVVLRQPMATLENLVAFLALEAGPRLDAAGAALVGSVTRDGGAAAWSTLGAVSPAVAGGALLGFSALTLASGWVVWRNVFVGPEVARARR